MRILYVFPHPDDESFGPARAISSQVRAGHAVFLLTLTRGGATKERHRFGYSIEEMGKVRLAEMGGMADVLGLADLAVLDFPDGGLKELDPRALVEVVSNHIEAVGPDVLVSYPVHGISGFHDHLVTHAVVKQAYVDGLHRGAAAPARLAFVTLSEEQASQASQMHRLSGSTAEEIDCLVTVEDEDMRAFQRALDCYVTYRETIERTGVRGSLDRTVAFEFYQEKCSPPVTDLCEGIVAPG